VVLVLVVLTLLGLTIAGSWLQLGRSTRSRVWSTAVAIVLAILTIVLATTIRTSFDLSENRRSSFAPAEERMLAGIDTPLTLTVFLAAEDPRMTDLEDNVLVKLRRTMPHLTVRYPLAGRSGLFENDDRYGEIVYRLGAKTETSRSTTEAIVLETIATLAGVAMPPPSESMYPGYPLAKLPAGAPLVFYGIWPAAVIAAWLMARYGLRNRRTG
jgi:hypothetical protein